MPAEVAKSAISIAQKLARGSILLLSGLGKKPNPLSLYLSLSLPPHTPNNQKKKREKETHSTTVQNKTQSDELSPTLLALGFFLRGNQNPQNFF